MLQRPCGSSRCSVLYILFQVSLSSMHIFACMKSWPPVHPFTLFSSFPLFSPRHTRFMHHFSTSTFIKSHDTATPPQEGRFYSYFHSLILTPSSCWIFSFLTPTYSVIPHMDLRHNISNASIRLLVHSSPQVSIPHCYRNNKSFTHSLHCFHWHPLLLYTAHSVPPTLSPSITLTTVISSFILLYMLKHFSTLSSEMLPTNMEAHLTYPWILWPKNYMYVLIWLYW